MLSRVLLAGLLAFMLVAHATAHIDVDLTEVPIDSANRVDRNPPATIEWKVVEGAESSLSFLFNNPEAQSARSQLFTFAVDATFEQIMHSEFPAALFSTSAVASHVQCSMLDGATEIVVGAKPSSQQSVGSVLQKHVLPNGQNSLKLSCTMTPKHKKQHTSTKGSSTRVFSFIQFVPQTYKPNEIRARNLIRRAVTGELQPYPLLAMELIGDSLAGLLGWAESFLKHHWGPLPAYLNYTTSTSGQTGRWHLNTGEILQAGATFGDESDEVIRIAAAADWAAGTLESDLVQQIMMNGNGTAFNPQWTLHIGDIYYLGAPEYVASNCLGQAPSGVAKGVQWPTGSLGSFAVMGNHEMYARAGGFFNNFLPTLGVLDQSGKPQGQDAGYVSLENKYWRVIMLDTGFNTYAIIPGMDNKNNTQPQAIMDWLQNEVDISNPDDKRGIIFFSHHQVESAFGSGEPSQATMDQIAAVLPANRTVVWLWGHEHKLSFYKLRTIGADNSTGVIGRCFGNGGFPANMADIPPRAQASGLIAYDDRPYELLNGFFPQKVTYNGFIHMVLDKATVSITYSSLTTDPTTGNLSPTLQTDLVQELFVQDEFGNTQLTNFAVLDPDITIVKS